MENNLNTQRSNPNALMRCAKNNSSRESRRARRDRNVWKRWRCSVEPEKWCCFPSELMRRAFLFILNINHKQFDDFTTKKMFKIRSLIAQVEKLVASNLKTFRQSSSRDRSRINHVQIHSYFQKRKWVNLSRYVFQFCRVFLHFTSFFINEKINSTAN